MTKHEDRHFADLFSNKIVAVHFAEHKISFTWKEAAEATYGDLVSSHIIQHVKECRHAIVRNLKNKLKTTVIPVNECFFQLDDFEGISNFEEALACIPQASWKTAEGLLILTEDVKKQGFARLFLETGSIRRKIHNGQVKASFQSLLDCVAAGIMTREGAIQQARELLMTFQQEEKLLLENGNDGGENKDEDNPTSPIPI